MKRSVLIIDDEKDQAEGLCKALTKSLSNTYFDYASEEEEITSSIENKYFSIAIIDLRMDKFSFDGIELINKIFEVNPFAKVIIVSAFTGEYFRQIKDLLVTGKIIDVIDKIEFSLFVKQLGSKINSYHKALFEDPSEINSALLEFYSQAKNEKNNFKKGEKFEHFVSLLFQSIGFKNVNKRIIDKSLNEVDLIIRNEIDDSFVNKFGKYILVECKNKPEDKVDKNTFIVFNNKLKYTNGLAELGILATTGYITRNTYLEAIRDSNEMRKVIFLSNPEFEKLIMSNNKLEEFKLIIDSQVKDN
ncbi:response regulator [Myroides sp. M-43]|uniref:response regulator n=1 Tax=Myroides oncorhynchi TaxID=2893756 RepID=UPI001E499787|nr:response regulator [Myroides oncorhynchi]MCC9043652.1 response regulator [Myroides oncorhynchi]